MNADIISIGDELLIGQIVDSNAAFIGRELTKVGVEVNQIKTVKDDQNQILEALESASKKADLILITGGLGPTKDDVTKTVFCAFLNDKLEVDEPTLEHIKSLFKRIDEPLLQSNIDQAKVPSKATVLKNKLGTAPGLLFEKEGVVFIALPGVPFEMKAILTDEVLPYLVKKYKLPFILQETVLTYGMGESRLADKLADWEETLPKHISLAYLPSPGRVRLRLTVRGQNKEQLQRDLQQQLEELRGLIGSLIGGYEGQSSLEKELADVLKAEGKTLATAESCTGGKITNLFTEMPGASQYFKGALVPYDTSIKVHVLGVPQKTIDKHSVVSAEVAINMAQRAKTLFASDYALATTGNAGPAKGDSDAEIGTVYIALASNDGVEVRVFHLGHSRERVVGKSIYNALLMLKEKLNKNKLI